MYAKLEPSGISVRRGAVQLRIDFCDDKDNILHSHFVQVSPDTDDEKILKLMKDCLKDFENKRSIRRTNYKPFDVFAPIEEMVFVSLRKGKKPRLGDNKMSDLLVKSAVKGLDIGNRKDSFIVSK